MPKYTVKEPLRFNGEPYAPGATVEMAAKQAEELIAIGALGAGVAAEEPKPATKPNAADSITLAKAAETTEALDELAKDEQRTTVLAAIEARRKELEA
jgi:hypothetical protein